MDPSSWLSLMALASHQGWKRSVRKCYIEDARHSDLLPSPQLLLVDSDDLVAREELHTSVRTVGVFDGPDVSLVRPFDDHHRNADEAISWATAQHAGAYHASRTAAESRVHLGKIGSAQLHGVALRC